MQRGWRRREEVAEELASSSLFSLSLYLFFFPSFLFGAVCENVVFVSYMERKVAFVWTHDFEVGEREREFLWNTLMVWVDREMRGPLCWDHLIHWGWCVIARSVLGLVFVL